MRMPEFVSRNYDIDRQGSGVTSEVQKAGQMSGVLTASDPVKRWQKQGRESRRWSIAKAPQLPATPAILLSHLWCPLGIRLGITSPPAVPTSPF